MIWQLVIELLIYIIIIIKYASSPIFLIIITIDGIFTAVKFFKKSCDKYNLGIDNEKYWLDEAKNGIVISQDNSLSSYYYRTLVHDINITFLDKYIYYLLLYLASSFLGIVFWFQYAYVFKCIIVFLSLSTFIRIFIQINCYKKVNTLIKETLKDLLLFFLCKLTVKLLNTLCEICLNCQPNYDYRELLDFYERIDYTIVKLALFIKNSVTLAIFYYIKKQNNVIYKYTTELIYKYHINDLLFSRSSLTVADKKDILAKIVSGRQWDEFLNANTISLFFEIYDTNENDNKLMRKMTEKILEIKFKFNKFLSIGSLITVNPYLGIITNLIFNMIHKTSRKNLESYILSIILIIFFDYGFLAAFVSVYGHIFLKPFIEYMKDRDYRVLCHYNEKNKYLFIPILMYILADYSCILIVPVLFIDDTHWFLTKTTIIIFLLLGYVSSFNIVHLILLTVITYISVNMNIYIKYPEIITKKLNLVYDSQYIKESILLPKSNREYKMINKIYNKKSLDNSLCLNESYFVL